MLVYGQTLDRYEMDLLYQMVFDTVSLRSEVTVVVLFQRRIIMKPKHFSWKQNRWTSQMKVFGIFILAWTLEKIKSKLDGRKSYLNIHLK